LYTPFEIDTLQDPKDKIQTQLYVHKLQELLKPVDGQCPLQKCSLCDEIYATKHNRLLCPVALPKIDVHGNIIKSHESNPLFNINDWIEGIFQLKGSWKSVFWNIWGYLECFRCQDCGRSFALPEIAGDISHQSSVPCSPSELFLPFVDIHDGCLGQHKPDVTTEEFALVMENVSRNPLQFRSPIPYHPFLITREFFEQLKPSNKGKARTAQKKQYLQRDQDHEQMQEWIRNMSLDRD
jgi:hypothetical protein